MTEVLVRDGTWTFNGDFIRIVPARERAVNKLRQALGELVVPLPAVAGIAYQPGRKGGLLKLRIREGADPFTQATGGRLPEAADPYRLTIDADRSGAAEYFADEVRAALLTEGVPEGPSARYLMPGPPVPLTANASDGMVTFDGDVVMIEPNWAADGAKQKAGPQRIPLADIAAVEWIPNGGMENGRLRFTRKSEPPTRLPIKHDPSAVTLWGLAKETRTVALLVTAVVARLPHPLAEPPMIEAPEEDHDVVLRRLRELGALHRDGVLTDEEFAAAKQALLKRL
ncbi:DUF4429 domain-containing protein [Herbidospora mongoliensis]|uniref:DUF4429 domain-containing protein n=1 Tax=Herbidospora mongoliensis TaxID=688067 RepID=UPI00083469F8|nr:DUF4429 domain-containing protein [Herbidospora mongoliensis]